MSSPSVTNDVVIVGGGPAGLSAALVLGRSLRSVVVIDEGKPRNASARRSHGYLTRDGIEPETLRMLAREELRRYETVDLRHDTVVEVSLTEGRFLTSMASGSSVISRVIVFASGMKEQLPSWHGLSDVYGRSVFPCPYCDGWELRGKPLAVLGGGAHLLSHIKLIHHWSRDLVVCSDGPAELKREEREQLVQRDVALYEQPIARLESSADGQLTHIVLADGMRIARSGAFLTNSGAHQATDIPRQLGIPLDETGVYKTHSHGLTRIPGLYIIGDAKQSFSGLTGAASEGYEAGVAINRALVEEDW
ncbi:NAD(P)/FAD-dependent oxidoreductase [Paenibacillus xylaniclasticus]|uniref:NAD(P)/FAD-dependent oxidoreductase n=1 Tax=Paenibacillus xylaniclasticus TaxID=588083 RepID=UPI000FD7DCEC|nr:MULTISPECIES: NAD(P)/FAD-dependent oxidoreductase [Paenibacillus]GFN30029.1 thioredoxin reductase [Paenibacillus curdlanolyticus]